MEKELSQEKKTVDNKKKKTLNAKGKVNCKNAKKCLSKISEFFNLSDLRSEVNQKNIKRFLERIFVECFSLIVELETDIVWLVISILYKILHDGGISKEERESIFYRIAYANYPILNLRLPFPEEVKIRIKEKTSITNGACKVLENLAMERRSSEEYDRKKEMQFFFFLEGLYKFNLVDIGFKDLIWLAPDLWPRRIIKITEGLEECMGDTSLSKRAAEKAFQKHMAPISITWTDGLKEEIDEEKLRKYCEISFRSEERKSYVWLMIEVLTKHYNEGSGNIGDFNPFLQIIADHEIVDNKEFAYFNLDIAYLLQKLHGEGALALWCFDSLCIKKRDKQINATLISPRSVGLMSSWSLNEILTDGFIEQSREESLQTNLDVMVELTSKAEYEDSSDLFWRTLMSLKEIFPGESSSTWLNSLKKMRQLIKLSLEYEKEEWVDLCVSIFSPEQNTADLDLVKWCIEQTIESSNKINFCQAPVLKLLQNFKDHSYQLPLESLKKALQLVLETDKGSDDPVIFIEEIISLLHITLSTTDTVCHFKEDRKEVLKEVVSMILSSLQLNQAAIENVEEFILCIDLILSNVNTTTFAEHCLIDKDLDGFALYFIESEINERTVKNLLEFMTRPKLIGKLQFMFDKLFAMLFDGNLVNCTHNAMKVFEILSQIYLHSNNESLRMVFKERIFEIIVGFSSKHKEFRECCIQVSMSVMEIDTSLKENLTRVLVNKSDTSRSIPNYTEKEKAKQQFVNVLERYAVNKSQSALRSLGVLDEKQCHEEVDRVDEIIKSNSYVTVKSSVVGESIQRFDDNLEEYKVKREPLIQTETMKKTWNS